MTKNLNDFIHPVSKQIPGDADTYPDLRETQLM